MRVAGAAEADVPRRRADDLHLRPVVHQVPVQVRCRPRSRAHVVFACRLRTWCSVCARSWVLSKDDGTPEMRRVSDPIREGAEGFLKVQYSVIGKLSGFVAAGIFMSYKLRNFDHPTGIESLGANTIGTVGAVAFLLVRGHGRGKSTRHRGGGTGRGREERREAMMCVLCGRALTCVASSLVCGAGSCVLRVGRLRLHVGVRASQHSRHQRSSVRPASRTPHACSRGVGVIVALHVCALAAARTSRR